jgi:hypothetical protein
METSETDERDTLSEYHRDYMARYVTFELLRQERVSRSLLMERAGALDLKLGKVARIES